MKKLFGVVAVAGMLSLGALTAYAQDASALVKVPFPFVASGTVLPAGSYRVELDGAHPNLVMLYSADGKMGVPIAASFGGDIVTDGQARFEFRKLSDYYFLSEVRVNGDYDRIIPLSTKTMTAQIARFQAEADHALGGTQH